MYVLVTIYVIGPQQTLHATTIKHNTAINKSQDLMITLGSFFWLFFKARPLLLLSVLCSGCKTNFQTFS